MSERLAGWENFYVIIGGSAGALIGLQFVVIALVSSLRRTSPATAALRAFASPVIVYFSSVLLTAGLLSIPHHTATSLGCALLAIGIAGAAYLVWVGKHMRRQGSYAPDRGDWLWFVILPAAAYACMLAAGALVWSAPGTALVVAGSAAMLLLLVGVHNAWDSAVWMVANAPGPEA